MQQSDTINGNPLGPRVVYVQPCEDYKLILKFTNGERRIFDARRLLDIPVFSPLKSKPFFDSVFIAYGTVGWPQDIDYCPDTLYMESIAE
jgi:hypothetical protein